MRSPKVAFEIVENKTAAFDPVVCSSNDTVTLLSLTAHYFDKGAPSVLPSEREKSSYIHQQISNRLRQARGGVYTKFVQCFTYRKTPQELT